MFQDIFSKERKKYKYPWCSYSHKQCKTLVKVIPVGEV